MALGYNPRFELAYEMTERMASKHAGELSYLELNWEVLENPDGKVIQVLPVLIMAGKGFG